MQHRIDTTINWVQRLRAEVPKGKKAGVHLGRVAIRRTGSFNVQTPGVRSRAFHIVTAVCYNAPTVMAIAFNPNL